MRFLVAFVAVALSISCVTAQGNAAKVRITDHDDVVCQFFGKKVEVINSSAVINNQFRFCNTSHMFFVKK